MLISPLQTEEIKKRLTRKGDVYCSGLFLSARWFILSQVASEGVHFAVLPTQEAAEYCAADLYNLIEGDRVFYLPASGKGIEKSNYKSSLGVQRTAAIERLISSGKELSVLVTYPEALAESIPSAARIRESLFTLKQGMEISFETIRESLYNNGFEKVDFVAAPGQYAIRGSLIDIFSFSNNQPYRFSFFGDEIESIHIFDANTQLSVGSVAEADILSGVLSGETPEGEGSSVLDILPPDSVLWLDSSDMYRNRAFFPATEAFRRVFLDLPISGSVPDSRRLTGRRAP